MTNSPDEETTMRPGPWRSILRREGYAVVAGEAPLFHTDPVLSRNEARDLSRAAASLPDLFELLADMEDYFGDRPRSDDAALDLHRRMTKLMNAVDIPLRSAV